MKCSALAESVSLWNRQRVEEELVLGLELANQLGRVLSKGDWRSAEGLVTKILCSFKNSLYFLNGSKHGSEEELSSHIRANAIALALPPQILESSASDAHKAVKRGAAFMDHRGSFKRRKKKMNSQAWSRDSPDSNDDGHAWRKSYFRCSHKHDQGCSATKQVQKLDDDSQLFRTTYYGNHTCTNSSFLKAPEFVLDAASTTPTEVSDSKITIIYDNSSNSFTNNQEQHWFSSTQNELIVKSSHTTGNQSSLLSSSDYLVSPDTVVFEPSEPISGGIPEIELDDLEDMFLGNARTLCLSRMASQSPQEASGFQTQLGFKEESEDIFDLESKPSDEKPNGIGPSKEANATLLGSDFQEPKSGEGEDMKEDGLKRIDENVGLKKVRQLMKRSSILAKQVISIESALSLGFVSQLWVNTTSWMVMFLEVRRNLLSGECERFPLEDVFQVGDVVLVEDESVIENDFKMVGLETLVGYKVVTPGRQTIGKVRGYSFNINSGAVESLELDSFGIALIPSSLVSTYALFVEDVLEVVSDAVIVHEAAASHIYRLTKGFLDNQNAATSIDDIEEYAEFERPVESDKRTRRSTGNQKFQSRKSKTDDDWEPELPMDYF
ncbi:hypothetical protein ACLB2K_065166 [Fragaria x ananassa]